MKSLAAKIFFRLLLLALLGAGVWLWFALSPVRHAPGILIQNAPIQTDGDATPIPASIKEYELTRLAGFHIQGRVLSVQRYHDTQSALAPFDLVLGWGPMSDTKVLSDLTFSQRSREYSFRWNAKPLLAAEEAVKQSANLHLIPANREIAALFGQLKPGYLVDFRGGLVEARKGSFLWRSSLVRDDTGPGSGELFYVTQACFFDGSQNLAAEGVAKTEDDLKRWFNALAQRRQSLDLNDPAAVREFNLEAQRYMAAAHPKTPPKIPKPSSSPSPSEKITGKAR